MSRQRLASTVVRIPDAILEEVKTRVEEYKKEIIKSSPKCSKCGRPFETEIIPKYTERDKIEVMKLSRIDKMRLTEKYGSIEAALEAGIRAEIRDGRRIVFTV